MEEVFRIIRLLKAEQVTMLLVEQFAMAALGVADHAYVLENGRIRFQGPAQQMRNDPAVRAAYLGGSHVPPPGRLSAPGHGRSGLAAGRRRGAARPSIAGRQARL